MRPSGVAFATAFAAIAGFLAVPGTPGVPNVLLAATAGGVTAVLAKRVSDCGATTLTAASCFAMVVAVAAFGGVLTGAPLYVIGAVAALVSLGLLGVAARVAIALAGLSPKPADPQGDESPADGLAAGEPWRDRGLKGLARRCAAILTNDDFEVPMLRQCERGDAVLDIPHISESDNRNRYMHD